MAKFCIPPLLAEQLKAAAQRGEIDIEKMYEMNSAERRAVFENYVPKDIAKQINTGFEKAMVSTKVTALQKWVTDTFVGNELKKKKKTIIDKIEQLQESGLLTPEKETGFYEDLIAEKLGLTVTPEEATKINDFASQLQKESDTTSEFGTPTLEYFQIRRKLQDYIESITPSSRLKVLTSIIGRGNMLLRVSSPFLNIESNTVMAAMQAFARRVENRRAGGVNNDYAIKYQKFALEIYQKTGFDITRMLAIDDDFTVRGEDIVTSQGKGAIRKAGRFYEDIVFKTMQGLPDVLYAGFSAADRSNIESTKIAASEGLKGAELKKRALEIFKDSTRIDPLTAEGKAVKNSAIADALYSTYTNKSVYSDISLGIRKIFNIASGDARIGDQIMPFVKTPANVIGAGLNMSGIGLPVDATYRMFKVLQDIKNGEGFTESMKSEYAGFWRTAVQAGIGITLAHIISSLFEPDDFIGEYPVTEKERQLLALKNATTNSVRIGDKWVSLDYFGSIGAALTGMLYAKKYGNDLPSSVYQYAKGTIAQASKLPGFENMTDIIDYLNELSDRSSRTISDEVRDMTTYAIGFVQSRLTPGILYDISKMTDTSERKNDPEDILSRVKMAIPGFRQELPEKKTVYGETVATEPAWSILMFGSRVKTAANSKLLTELERLDAADALPSITDVSKTSSRAKELKEQIGTERFDEFMTEFGKELAVRSERFISSSRYKRLPDDKKKEELDKIKNDVFDRKLRKFGYRKPK